MKLIVIGFGNMGSAIVKALQKRDEPLFASIAVLDPSEEKRAVAQDMGLEVWETLESAVIDEDSVILLAVKPQDMDDLLESLKGKLYAGALLMSIAAGVSLERLKAVSGHESIVRVMPNTPALVGKGASGWMVSEAVTAEQKDLVKKMLGSFGMAVEVTDEDQMDMVTALSGSGPAYVFYFLEALVEGGEELGLEEDVALKLALQTVVGGAALAESAKDLDGLQQLCANVTSKGGTTEKAIEMFDEGELKKLVAEAMDAAYKRAKEL